MFKSQLGQLEVRLGLGTIQESWGLKGGLVIHSGFAVLRESLGNYMRLNMGSGH